VHDLLRGVDLWSEVTGGSMSSLEFFTDICACGHPASRHELAGTEYARCGFMGSCWCSGGVRVAIRVKEDAERVNAVRSNAKFFRRHFKFEAGAEHPLMGGIRKSVDSGIEFQWVAYECDRCGDGADSFVAYMAEVDDDSEPQIEVHEVCGRTVLICQTCDNEVRESLSSKAGVYGTSSSRHNGVTLLEW